MSELNDRVTSSAIYIYMIVLVEEWINITNNISHMCWNSWCRFLNLFNMVGKVTSILSLSYYSNIFLAIVMSMVEYFYADELFKFYKTCRCRAFLNENPKCAAFGQNIHYFEVAWRLSWISIVLTSASTACFSQHSSSSPGASFLCPVKAKMSVGQSGLLLLKQKYLRQNHKILRLLLFWWRGYKNTKHTNIVNL